MLLFICEHCGEVNFINQHQQETIMEMKDAMKYIFLYCHENKCKNYINQEFVDFLLSGK